MRFTAKERDAETGLDYFNFRYMSSAQGRFTSPDEPFGGWDQHDPQSFNLYNYAANNPLRYTDPDGHDVRVCVNNDNGGQNCFTVTDAQYKNLYNQQNGQQGIGLPTAGANAGAGGGLAIGGAITCGGSVCGSATYGCSGSMERKTGLRTYDRPHLCRWDSCHLLDGIRWIAQGAQFATPNCLGNGKRVSS
jgi:RHS repeat-associated protein